MTNRRLVIGGTALTLIGLLVVLLVPSLRHSVFGTSESNAPPAESRSLPSGWGGLNSSPISGDDWAGKGRLTPGIDFCSFAASSGLGDFVFFIWGDFNGGASGTNTVNKYGLQFRGYLRNQPENRRVEFGGDTKDGKTGRVTIEGKEYDLAKGTLFLVSARRDYQVKQLKADLSRFRDAEELYKELSKKDRDVVVFFGGAAAPK